MESNRSKICTYKIFLRLQYIPYSYHHTKYKFFCKRNICAMWHSWHFYRYRVCGLCLKTTCIVIWSNAGNSHFGKHFEYIWICTFAYNDIFISNCFSKCKKMYWLLFSECKANKQTTPILTTVPRHPNKTATNSTITFNRTC